MSRQGSNWISCIKEEIMANEIQFECLYCGYKWMDLSYNLNSYHNEKCSTCQSKDIKVRRKSDLKIDTYVTKIPKRNLDDVS